MDPRRFENHWFALQVRSGREQFCAQILQYKGYEQFLPVARQSLKPLFPGYMFCRLSSDVYGPVVTTPAVIRVVAFGNTPTPVSQEEIDNVRRLIESDRPACPWPYTAVGERVCITSGALKGITGILLRVKNLQRLIVSVDLLLRSVAVELDAESVRSANSVPQYRAFSKAACG